MILNYDLYIFDFDGTLLDTEDAHYKAWNKLLPSLTITEYYIFCHSLDKTLFKKYITDNGLDYDNIYKQKIEGAKKIKQRFFKEYNILKKVSESCNF